MVAYCLDKSTVIDALTMNEFKEFSELFDEDIYTAISLETCVNQRSLVGGPAVETMRKIIEEYKKQLN